MNMSYAVTFYKLICDPHGRQYRCPQGTVIASDTSRESALEQAKQKFAAERSAADWTLRAEEYDVYRIEEGERAT